jgi:hypothetical protein
LTGHIRQIEENVYRIVIDFGKVGPTGKRVRKTVTVKGSKHEAEQLLAQALFVYEQTERAGELGGLVSRRVTMSGSTARTPTTS